MLKVVHVLLKKSVCSPKVTGLAVCISFLKRGPNLHGKIHIVPPGGNLHHLMCLICPNINRVNRIIRSFDGKNARQTKYKPVLLIGIL